MATIEKSNNDNFLTWNKITGTLSPEDLQANGLNEVNTPQNLAVASGFVLTWDDKSNFETGVEIHRKSESETKFKKIGEVGENVETYTDSSTSVGITYYYKVRAYFDNGVGSVKYGSFSNEVNYTFALTWTSRSASEQSTWQSVSFGNNVFVAVSSAGKIMRSTNNGETWSAITPPSSDPFIKVRYGNGVFISLQTVANQDDIIKSTDYGVSWSTVSGVLEANSWKGLAYGNSTWVAVSSNGTNRTAWSDDDGETWNAVASSEQNSWRSVCYGNGVFIAVSDSGTNRVMRSTDDGVSWSAVASSEQNSWRDVIYVNGIFIAVSQGGTNASMISVNDGVSWVALSTADNSSNWTALATGSGIYVSVATGGTIQAMFAEDTSTVWNPSTVSESNIWSDLAFGNNTFVSISPTGTNRVMTGTV
jgi:hypothetical protein